MLREAQLLQHIQQRVKEQDCPYEPERRRPDQLGDGVADAGDGLAADDQLRNEGDPHSGIQP